MPAAPQRAPRDAQQRATIYVCAPHNPSELIMLSSVPLRRPCILRHAQPTRMSFGLYGGVYTLTLPVVMPHRIAHVETHAGTHAVLTQEFDLFIGDAFGGYEGWYVVCERTGMAEVFVVTHTHTATHMLMNTHSHVYDILRRFAARARQLDGLHRSSRPHTQSHNRLHHHQHHPCDLCRRCWRSGGRRCGVQMGGFLMWPHIQINHYAPPGGVSASGTL